MTFPIWTASAADLIAEAQRVTPRDSLAYRLAELLVESEAERDAEAEAAYDAGREDGYDDAHGWAVDALATLLNEVERDDTLDDAAADRFINMLREVEL